MKIYVFSVRFNFEDDKRKFFAETCNYLTSKKKAFRPWYTKRQIHCTAQNPCLCQKHPLVLVSDFDFLHFLSNAIFVFPNWFVQLFHFEDCVLKIRLLYVNSFTKLENQFLIVPQKTANFVWSWSVIFIHYIFNRYCRLNWNGFCFDGKKETRIHFSGEKKT